MAKISILYRDDEYVLFQKQVWFGLSKPILCSYWVVYEPRQLQVKATRDEKTYLLCTLQYYVELGGDPVKLRRAPFFREFAEAVIHRGHLRGRFFFETQSPMARANELYVDQMVRDTLSLL